MLHQIIGVVALVHCVTSLTILKPGSCDSIGDANEIEVRISQITESLLQEQGVVKLFIDDGGGNSIYNYEVPPTPYANAKELTFTLETNSDKISLQSDSSGAAFVLKIVGPHLNPGFYSIWIEIEHPRSSLYAPSETRSDVVSFHISNSQQPPSLFSLKKSIVLKQHQLDDQEAEKKERRDKLAPLYRPLMIHPELLELQESEVFDPRFLEFLKSNPQSKDDLMKFLHKEAESGIYSFPLLKKEFCTKLLEEIDNIHQSKVEAVAPNTMNNYGVILDDFGFKPFLNQLMLEYLKPLSSILFPEWGGKSLDGHHGFIVQYQLGEDLELSNHMDSCEITLNVCLGKDFKGGELLFQGVRNSQSEFVENIRIKHSPGHALLHVGQHWHGALPITEGSRYNLILWMMSSTFRQSPSEKYYHQCALHHQHIPESTDIL